MGVAVRTAAVHRAAEARAFSQDTPSDVTVVVSGIAYALHKVPLVSRSGWIRRAVSELIDLELPKIELSNLPGGAEAFESAAKFCYGISFEIGAKNVVALRCAAEYLEMTEEYTEENLIARTEDYLDEMVYNSLQTSVAVLHSCEDFLPLAEELGILTMCVDAVASKACKEQMTPSLSRSDLSSSGHMEGFRSPGNFSQTPMPRSVEWWVEDVSMLCIDSFKKVVLAMKARGVRGDSLGPAIAFYAKKWLRGLLKKQAGQLVEMWNRAKQMKLTQDLAMMAEQEQHRELVETLVSCLPPEKGICSVSILFALLRAACYLEVSGTCREEIEKRAGWQLEQAVVDDLLIPSFSNLSDTYFDLGSISRIAIHFLQQEGHDGEEGEGNDATYAHASKERLNKVGISPPPQSAVMKAARVLDSFLAEVAPDANLSVSKFVTFAELMPSYARFVDDGLYRAIDIYLKAHPGLSEIERKKVASLMDCQKLSQEACTHAAQNERLPVHVVVQVLYFEQMRLKGSMPETANLEENLGHGGSGQSHVGLGVMNMGVISPAKTNSGQFLERIAQRRSIASTRPEHYTPRIKAKQMQMSGNFEDAELPPAYEQARFRADTTTAGAGVRPPVAGYMKHDGERPRVGFFQSMTIALSRFNPFQRLSSSNDAGIEVPNTPDARSRRRRHSLS